MHESHDKDNWLSWCGGFEGRGELLPLMRCRLRDGGEGCWNRQTVRPSVRRFLPLVRRCLIMRWWGGLLESSKCAAAGAVAHNN